jgi:hypothetical protein
VKPVAQLPPLPTDSRSIEAGGVTIRVGEILSDEQSYKLFETNLPLSGILAIRTELTIENSQPVELKKVRFRLRDDKDREWKLLTVKQAVSRIMKANDVYIYTPDSKKQFTTDLQAYALDLKAQLSETQPKQSGFLFFQSPDKGALDMSQRFALTLERLPQPLTIRLN